MHANKNKVDDLIRYLKDELTKNEKNYQLESTKMYMELMIQYYERANRAQQEGRFVAGHCVLSPVEIFYALDLVPFHLEGFSLFLNFFEDLQPYLQIAKQWGMANEICSVHRALIGMIKENSFPPPDATIWSSLVCDNTVKSGEGMVDLYGSHPYFLDHPYVYNEKTLEYYARDLQEMTRFLEGVSGKKLDRDKLEEAVRLSAEVHTLTLEINELRKTVPSPMPSESMFALMATNWYCCGTPEAVAIHKKLRDEVKENVEKKRGAVPNERFRLLFSFILPVFNLDLMTWMEEEYGASFILCPQDTWLEGAHWYQPGEDLYKSLARRYFTHAGRHQFHGPMKEWSKSTLQVCRDYKIDGVIFFSHLGCRQACAAIRTLKDQLKEKVDVPLVAVDCDLTDKSISSPEEMKEKLEQFFEMLQEREVSIADR